MESLLSTRYTTLLMITKPSGAVLKTTQYSFPTRGSSSSSSRNLYRRQRQSCRTSASPLPVMADLDLYELLGVDSSSDQTQIKLAYRALQKRCHPDIAGPAGHDMAIILNQVYTFLSDPASRSAYDQEQAKLSQFRGYTGKPLYSTWFGSETEQRAVFVDEVKCVGCLKCALFAKRTFAIESVYGRARVVSQWADPEDKILDAIQICPVDCISVVERSDLAALEFLMSKQPRGNVRMTAGNTGGARVSNIFVDVGKFQSRYSEMKGKSSINESKVPDLHKESSINSAVQGIKSISNWWYWRAPTSGTTSSVKTCLNLTITNRRPSQPNIERLEEAVAKLKARETGSVDCRSNMCYKYGEEYWTPTLVLPSPSNSSSMASPLDSPATTVLEDAENVSRTSINDMNRSPVSLKAPIMVAVVSAAVVGLRGEEMMGGGLKDHIGGTMALEVVNSFELQILLAGTTWFVIGMTVLGLVEALGSKGLRR